MREVKKLRNGGGCRELESLWLKKSLHSAKPWPTAAMLEIQASDIRWSEMLKETENQDYVKSHI